MSYRICVSGAAVTSHCAKEAFAVAKELGEALVRHNCILLTGATTGVSYWVATSLKEHGGISIGFSPAFSERDHKERYSLPTDQFDVIVYTGFHYSGRNLLLTRASDAVIILCGRMGTLNEFTIAFEDGKPIGILEGTGGIADEIRSIVRHARKPGSTLIVYERNPEKLIEKLIRLIEEERKR